MPVEEVIVAAEHHRNDPTHVEHQVLDDESNWILALLAAVKIAVKNSKKENCAKEHMHYGKDYFERQFELSSAVSLCEANHDMKADENLPLC